ncbi:MAG: cation diffusion facilitator family transporter [Verrucomicrobia bacterium]|nr:cation diffusion facilitator family transporter [Verrucomicrobiota bacterium]MDA1086409.1 cation diffusion facilitator family transporter [Verrucomicrobiota bacterium]
MIDTGKAVGLGILTVCVNIVLMLVKIAAGVLGNSYALIADGIESAADIFTSLITWAGFHFSLRPADDRHPFGHGKVESLTGIFSGSALLAAAGLIAYHSVQEIITPHHSPAWFTLPVLIAVVVTKEMLSRRILALGGDLESRALESDAWHHRSDAMTSGAAAVGISISLVGGPGWAMADDWAALLACGIIVVNGVRVIRASLHDVLDGNVDPEIQELVTSRAAAVDGVGQIETCRMRKSGVGYFVELHVQVDGDLSVNAGHQIAHEVKSHLLADFPQLLDVMVHVEPTPNDEETQSRGSSRSAGTESRS